MTMKKKASARIALRTVLEHVQAQGGALMSFRSEMKKEFDAVHEKIDGVERHLTRQIDGLDKRLDDIEIVQIPKLKKTVGARS